METSVINGQSLFDLAIQMCGSIESVFELAQISNLSVTDMPETGTLIESRIIADQDIYDYYRERGIKPVTGSRQDENAEGIGFWSIEKDFIVS